MQSDVKITNMGKRSPAEDAYHKDDVTFDDLAKEAGFPNIRRGDFPPIADLYTPEEGA